MKISRSNRRDNYVTIAPSCFLKLLEDPCLYSTATDELYELNQDAFTFLEKCDGTIKLGELEANEDFVDYLVQENLVEFSPQPKPRKLEIGRGASPSLRYLSIEVTGKCNLKCRHCYQGEAQARDLSWELLSAVLGEFETIGGLRLIVGGGEPLLYPHFERLNEAVRGRSYRSILMTNATKFSPSIIRSLNFSEVQVSLDGMKKGHEALRGAGSFEKVLGILNNLAEEQFPFSIATIVHRYNLEEFPFMEKIIKDLGALSWSIDLPAFTGQMKLNQNFMPPLGEAIALLRYSFGSELHESEGSYACGSHLACVKVDGLFTKCGYYREISGGYASKGLSLCWEMLPKVKLEELNCKCDFLEGCRGGCRYRAELNEGRYAPDPFKCLEYGIARGNFSRDYPLRR